MSTAAGGRRVAILILGMHRSGTSALARVVNLLGAEIGARLIPPGFDNPTGFWESKSAVEIDEQLLRDLGRTWYDMREMPSGWMETAAAGRALGSAQEFIRSELGGSALCALKDPRVCLVAPLWIKAFESLGYEVRCLFIVRNPQEVVESLHRRNDWPRSPLYLMWVQYLLKAEAATQRYRRTMVSYDALLDDWRGCMARVATDLGLTWSAQMDAAAPAIDTFLDGNQRHHRALSDAEADLQGSNATPTLVRSLYAACIETSKGGNGWEAIAHLHADFRKAAELYAERVDTVLMERWQAEAKAQTSDAKARTVEAELAQRKSVEGVIQDVASRSIEELQSSRKAMDAGFASLGERFAALETHAQGATTEQATHWRHQTSQMAEVRDAVQLAHDSLKARIEPFEQNLLNSVQYVRQDVAELDGRILRHQEVLQAVEARLQRQYALLNTVLLAMEQAAGERLGDRVSALAAKVDATSATGQAASDQLRDRISALTEKIGSLRGAELQALRQDLNSSNAKLSSLVASTSWRLTRPLRWISVHVLRRPPPDE